MAKPSKSASNAEKPEGELKLETPKKTLKEEKENRFTVFRLCLAAMIAALYVVLTLPMASFTFGIVQFRLAEVLTVLPVISMAAVPGVFVGCLIANILNPQNLGLIDILCGSGATLLAAWLSWWMAKPYRKRLMERNGKPAGEDPSGLKKWKLWTTRVLLLLPPVVVNAFTVGIYLPYLLMEDTPTRLEVAGSVAMIMLSQAVVVYAIGLPLLCALEKSRLPFEKL